MHFSAVFAIFKVQRKWAGKMSFLALNIQNGVKSKNFEDFNFFNFFTVLERFQNLKTQNYNQFYKEMGGCGNKTSGSFSYLGDGLGK